MPDAQDEQPVKPVVDAYVPRAQLVQALALLEAEYWPAMQLTHTEEDRYVPAAHVVEVDDEHADAPAAAVRPVPQTVQIKAPNAEYVLEAHAEHELAPAVP